MEFKDFLRTSPKIQGLFKTVRTLIGFFKQEAGWIIYLTWVVRGQLDPVFGFKDEYKSEQDFKIKLYNMYRFWNAVSVGYAQ